MLELSPASPSTRFPGVLNTVILVTAGMSAPSSSASSPRASRLGWPVALAGGHRLRRILPEHAAARAAELLRDPVRPRNLGITADPIIVGIIGLSIYTGAFVAEAIRSGILSVDPRQVEAARSLGLGQVATLRLVVLPQAIRTVIPPLGNISIALIKNTAIVGAIAANELLKVAGVIETRTASFDGYMAALVAYWCLTIPLAFVVSRIERRLEFAR